MEKANGLLKHIDTTWNQDTCYLLHTTATEEMGFWIFHGKLLPTGTIMPYNVSYHYTEAISHFCEIKTEIKIDIETRWNCLITSWNYISMIA